ncbi:MAG: single-stranded DNA-binding protein [Bacteroidales bacterium]|jgi:single-strand DNA-binding protein|nr:single-stranded DNA-binding protein [Bacteroidales bacterium]
MVNKVILLGRVGKDPEVRHLDNDLTVARFPLATDEWYRNKEGEKVTQTEWHNIVLWRQLAELAEKWVTKGKLLYIEGKIRTRSWEKDGVKHYSVDIEGDVMRFAGNPSENPSSAVVTPASAPNVETTPLPVATGDDLPF